MVLSPALLMWGSTRPGFRVPTFLIVSAAPGFHPEKHEKHGTAFHFYPKDGEIYVLVKKKDALSI